MIEKSKIRVLVADDSAFMRKKIVEILSSDPDINVIAVAKDGKEAIESANSLKPDVITLDIEMPVMSGLDALGYIMSEMPTPCVIISAFTAKDSEQTLKALEYGAVDFVTKPSGVISLNIDEVAANILAKVKNAARVPVNKLKLIYAEASKCAAKKTGKVEHMKRIIIIASSTGGTQALAILLPAIEKDIPAAILVVQHMPAGFTKSLAERLDKISQISVREAANGMILHAGEAVVAKGGSHLEISGTLQTPIITLSDAPPVFGLRPCADFTMKSAAASFSNMVVGVVLTGMGSDGTLGSSAIKSAGGVVIAQDEASSVIYGMPKSVVSANLADKVLPLSGIAQEIHRILR
ncbi:MAG: chemotaxis response regulator protein-glutamate methylesterase [Myxococcales bacterium]|nr:chemotaxis response regulator protein-glutamate methylesterase [Myxococcales bacterium]